MIERNLSGDQTAELCVDSQATLRELQPEICKAFRVPFPLNAASLVVGEQVFDGFCQQPFMTIKGDSGEHQVTATVLFEQATDMFWFDRLFRNSTR